MQYLQQDILADILGHDEYFCPKNDIGSVFWFTGLSGAGKTTLTYAVKEALYAKNKNIVVFDGDVMRKGLCNNLSFSIEDRMENIRRVAEVAKIFSSQGFICLCALIAPQENLRHMARTIIGENYYEIFVSCPLDECERRDVKGYYAKARSGQIANYTGVAARYEPPSSPNLVVETSMCTIEESVKLVKEFIIKKISLHAPMSYVLNV